MSLSELQPNLEIVYELRPGFWRDTYELRPISLEREVRVAAHSLEREVRVAAHSLEREVQVAAHSLEREPPRDQAAGLPVKLSAGADLLHKYQTEWSELHKQSEENAHQAQVVDSVIARLHHTCEKQSLEIVRMSTALANLPQLIDSVQLLMDQIASLQGLFEEVETGVLRLEDMIEIQELQEKQLEHRFQFALYKEKKLSELESLKGRIPGEARINSSPSSHSLVGPAPGTRASHLSRVVPGAIYFLSQKRPYDLHSFSYPSVKSHVLNKDVQAWFSANRSLPQEHFSHQQPLPIKVFTSVVQVCVCVVKLAREHADKVLQYEMKQQRLLKERQATFQQAFNQDLHEFKQTGFLPGSDSQRSVGRGPSLEEVTLDPGDLAELDNFLNESSDGQVS
uniref:Dysbindin domain-containing protein 1 n=1 Tax=Timema genevievae TaxID=629358 RepID=A0A7R9JWY2_TIMGE|nr:unnamed protein product [Timema genevievae]